MAVRREAFARHARTTPKIDLLSSAICVLIFFVIGRPIEVLQLAIPIPIGNLLVAAIFCLFVYKWKTMPKVPVLRSRIGQFACWLFVFATLSGFYSVYRTASLEFYVDQVIPLAVLFAAVSISCASNRIFRRYLMTLALTTAFLAVFLLKNWSGGRAYVSGAYDENDVALAMMIGIPILLWFASRRKGVIKLALFGLVGVQIFAILVTQSRGALVSLLVAAFVLWLTSGARTSLARKIGLACVFAVVGLGAWQALPDDARQRLDLTGISSDYNVNDEWGRLSIWAEGLDIVRQRPWGVGVGGFNSALGLYAGKYRAPHNSYLQILAELGVVAGVLFVIMWYRLFGVGSKLIELAKAGKTKFKPDEAAHFAWLWRAAIAGAAVGTFFLSQGYFYFLWTLFALAVGIEARHASTDNLPKKLRTIRSYG